MNIFYTLDTETYLSNSNLDLYCLSYTHNNNTKSFVLDNNDIFLKFLQSLIYEKYLFYIHNLTFDTAILFKYINMHCTNIT